MEKRKLFLIGLIVLFFLLDRFVKELVQHSMMVGESIPVIQNVFHITYVYNPGAAFSLFHQYPFLLLIITSLLFVIFMIYSLLKPTLSTKEFLGLSLILGGALGNIGDRLIVGKVIDYLDFTLIDYPIFNLADAFIFGGICLLLLTYVRQNKRKHHNAIGL